jgi:hypothetical protein
MVMSPPDPEPWIWERSMPKSFALRFAAFVALGSSTVRSLADCPCFWRIDREERNAEQRKDLDRRSDGKVTFTKRRMYKNYLLNSQAIASVVSTLEGFSERGEVTPDDVEIWLEDHGEDPMYFGGSEKVPSRSEYAWSCNVHGAKLLEELFRDVSETRVAYDKVVHGPRLTRWLIENEPEDLEELAQLIEKKLDPGVASQSGDGLSV